MRREGAVIRRDEDVDEGGRGPSGGEELVGSCDVKALYPSLRKKECAEVVGKLVKESKMEVRGVNYEYVGMAISMMAKKIDIYRWGLQGLCPERTGRRGTRPGLADMRNARGKWGKVRKPVGKVEKLKMLAKFVELSVVEVFEAHVYEYGGRIFVQSDGGPIGLSLSGAIGRTTMAVWDGEVGRLCKENGIVMRFRRRYVDDCNGTIQDLLPQKIPWS